LPDAQGTTVSPTTFGSDGRECELISLPHRIAADAHKAHPTEARRAALRIPMLLLGRMLKLPFRFSFEAAHGSLDEVKPG